jgi:DNA-binding response OmpR family regulator
MLTAHGTMESAIEALRLGAHDYLVKPCPEQALKLCVEKGMKKRRDQEQQRTLMRQLTELTETVRDLAGEEPKVSAPSHPPSTERMDQPEDLICCGELTIDLGKHEVVVGDKSLDLTPIEFGLLVSLASHVNKVRTSRELVKEVQGYDCEEREAREIIRWHISRLRKKMGPRAHYIETVWGIGYKFASP